MTKRSALKFVVDLKGGLYHHKAFNNEHRIICELQWAM